jgi:hypothetical protein
MEKEAKRIQFDQISQIVIHFTGFWNNNKARTQSLNIRRLLLTLLFSSVGLFNALLVAQTTLAGGMMDWLENTWRKRSWPNLICNRDIFPKWVNKNDKNFSHHSLFLGGDLNQEFPEKESRLLTTHPPSLIVLDVSKRVCIVCHL